MYTFYTALIVLCLLIGVRYTAGENVIEKMEDKLHDKNTTNEVTIYTESNYWGIPWTIAVTNCTDVPSLFYKKASSINTYDNCVFLYSREQCHGRHVQVAPGTDGHSRLKDIDFDNTLASLQLCDENWDSKPPRKANMHAY